MIRECSTPSNRLQSLRTRDTKVLNPENDFGNTSSGPRLIRDSMVCLSRSFVRGTQYARSGNSRKLLDNLEDTASEDLEGIHCSFPSSVIILSKDAYAIPTNVTH